MPITHRQELAFLQHVRDHLEQTQSAGWLRKLLRRHRLQRIKARISGLEHTIATGSRRRSKLRIGPSRIEGLGVFANATIKANELVEEAPYIMVTKELLQYQTISDYLFAIDDEWCAIVFGCGSIYNHSSFHNLRCSIDRTNGVVRYYAKTKIAAGEELTITYGSDWFAERSIQMK